MTTFITSLPIFHIAQSATIPDPRRKKNKKLRNYFVKLPTGQKCVIFFIFLHLIICFNPVMGGEADFTRH